MVPVVRNVIAVRPLSMAQIARGGGIHGSAPFDRSLAGEAGGLPSLRRSRLWRPGDHSESMALADPLPRGDLIV